MPVKQYRCVVSALAIRTQPKLGDQYKIQQQIKLNDVIRLNDDSRTEAAGYVWLQHDRGWSAERTVDGQTIFLLDASLRPRERMWGINIDPYTVPGNPQSSKLAGLGWVRFVFQASSKKQTPEQAFAHYDSIIRSYVDSGSKILLVVLQDTYQGNMPWLNSGSWDSYIQGFADTLSKVASHYKGQIAAYEIWNEPDLTGQPTSIYIPPQTYGPLLLASTQAIKRADPQAMVISGGLASGDAAGYLARVRDSLGGVLPVDGIAWHPYGQTPPDAPVFPNYSRGSLITGLERLRDAFPGLTLWITEVGVPRVDVNNTAFWPPIANYMLKTFQLIQGGYFHCAPVVIWFAWSDSMDRAGIVHDNQQPKGSIFDAFFQNLRADQPTYVRAADTPYNGEVLLAHVAGNLLSEQSIDELGKRICSLTPNVGALLVRTSTGTAWEGRSDSKPGMAINDVSEIGNWVSTLAKYRLGFHAWHELVGQDVKAESALIAQAAQAPGVGSIVLDLDAGRLALKSVDAVRNFMLQLRQALPDAYHIGVSFMGRPMMFPAINLPEWFPFISSWHPKIFHWQFGNGKDGPASYIGKAFDALKPYPKPILPMLQAAPNPDNKPVPPDQIRLAARLSLESYNAPAISYWRLGAIGAAEFTAIQGINVPYTAGYAPVSQSASTLTVQTNTPLRVRSTPSLMADVTGTLQPGQQITVLDRSVIGSIVWVRHSAGWSVSRNGQTGEIYLA